MLISTCFTETIAHLGISFLQQRQNKFLLDLVPTVSCLKACLGILSCQGKKKDMNVCHWTRRHNWFPYAVGSSLCSSIRMIYALQKANRMEWRNHLDFHMDSWRIGSWKGCALGQIWGLLWEMLRRCKLSKGTAETKHFKGQRKIFKGKPKPWMARGIPDLQAATWKQVKYIYIHIYIYVCIDVYTQTFLSYEGLYIIDFCFRRHFAVYLALVSTKQCQNV